MTEAEWAASRDSHAMLRRCRRFIRQHPRKGRLVAVACCYRIWHLLTDPRSRAAVDVAAQHVELLASKEEMLAALQAAGTAHHEAFAAKGKEGASAEWAAYFAADPDAWHAAEYARNYAYVAAGDPVVGPGPEKAAQAQLIRCALGPLPFRPVTFDSVWRTWNGGAAVKLAQAIYDGQRFGDLPILADALEEAGCDNADVLAHCRQPGEHVRGCWVVDLVLGKE
jgi:hypothetical protein